MNERKKKKERLGEKKKPQKTRTKERWQKEEKKRRKERRKEKQTNKRIKTTYQLLLSSPHSSRARRESTSRPRSPPRICSFRLNVHRSISRPLLGGARAVLHDLGRLVVEAIASSSGGQDEVCFLVAPHPWGSCY